MSAPRISLVVPMFDEVDLVERLVAAVREQVAPLDPDFELICVDDGSSDGTGERLLALQDPRVVPILLSRNFGKESAMMAGLQAARGAAVILMDGDLQHPPELIPQLVARWEAGDEVVNAVKQDRGRESWLYGLASRGFYALMGRAMEQELHGQSDFKLLDRQVVDAVLACPERNRFFRGLVAWLGFQVSELPFSVAERAGGTTSWSLAGLLRYSVRNIVSFTSLPLISIAWLGFVTTGFGVALGAQTLWNYLQGVAVEGFTTAILVQLIVGGAILTCLGVIALYLAVIYDELKRRPVFVVRRPRNPSSASSPAPSTESASPIESPAGQ